MLRYPRINVIVFTDTFFAKKKTFTSTRGNTCCQVFVTENNYVTVKPMTSRSGFPKALKSFFKDEGVPPAIVADGAKEQVKGESLRLYHQVGCEIRELEQGTPYSNRAERYKIGRASCRERV